MVYFNKEMLYKFCYLNEVKHIRTANIHDIYLKHFVLTSSHGHHTTEFINGYLKNILYNYIKSFSNYAYHLYYQFNLGQYGYPAPSEDFKNLYRGIYPKKKHNLTSAIYFYKHWLNRVCKVINHLNKYIRVKDNHVYYEMTEDEIQNIYLDLFV